MRRYFKCPEREARPMPRSRPAAALPKCCHFNQVSVRPRQLHGTDRHQAGSMSVLHLVFSQVHGGMAGFLDVTKTRT